VTISSQPSKPTSPTSSITPSTKPISPTYSKKLSSTPSQPIRKEVYVVNPVCSNDEEKIQCPNSKCTEDPSTCSGSVDIRSDVKTSTEAIPTSSKGKTIVINISGFSGRDRQKVQLARLEFPPDVLRGGWRVVIQKPIDGYDKDALEDSNRCDKTKSELASPAFQITGISLTLMH